MTRKSNEVISAAQLELLFRPRWWRGPWAIATISSRGSSREPFWLLVATSAHKGMLLELKFGAKGYVVSGAPKGWKIRRDRDTASKSGDYHYHCEKLGDEYVVKQNGTGSHATLSGTELPKKLGRFLYEQLDVDLDRSQGNYIVHCLPAWSWESHLKRWAIDLVGAALNAEVDE